MFASTNHTQDTNCQLNRAWSDPTVTPPVRESTARVTAAIAKGKHPVPSRTRKLSLSAPMVLQPRGCGRVGRRRTSFRTGPPPGWPCFAFPRPSSLDRGPAFRPQVASATRLSTTGRRRRRLSAPPGIVAAEVMCMPAQQKKAAGDPIVAVNEVRLVGRVSQAARGAGAAQRRRRSGRSGWWCAPAGVRGSQRGRRARVRRVEPRARRSVASWQPDDVVEVTGAVRRGSSGPAAAPRRASRWRWPRPAHSSRRERMSTPTLGLGWKDVAFSGQQTAVLGGAQHVGEVGDRHQDRESATAGDRAEGLVDRVRVADRPRPLRQRRQHVLVQDLDREPVVGPRQGDGGPVVPVGDDDGASARGRRSRPAGRRPGARRRRGGARSRG